MTSQAITAGGASRRLAITGMVALSIFVCAAALSWACSPQAFVSITPDGAVARSAATVTFRGSNFPSEPVQIRWGSATGESIGQATGPSFSVPVTIPETAQPGVYYIVVVTQGGQVSPATSFEVTEPAITASVPAAADQSSDPTPPPATATGVLAQQTPGAGGPAAAGAPSATVPSKDTGAAKSTVSTPAKPSGAGRSRHPAGKPAPRSAAHARVTGPASASSNAAVLRTPGGRAVFGGSVAPATVPAGRRRRAAVTPAKRAASSPQTPLPARQPSVARGPSLAASSADPRMQPSSPGSTLMLGIGLLAVGTMALSGGALVAVVRRRRSPVTRTRATKP